MKVIPKGMIDEIIDLIKTFQETSDVTLLDQEQDKAIELSVAVFGTEYRWVAFWDLLNAVFGPLSLCKNATNHDIYRALEIFGYELREYAPEREAV